MPFKPGSHVRICKPGSKYHYRWGVVQIVRSNGQILVEVEYSTLMYVYPTQLMSAGPLNEYAYLAAMRRVYAWKAGWHPVI